MFFSSALEKSGLVRASKGAFFVTEFVKQSSWTSSIHPLKLWKKIGVPCLVVLCWLIRPVWYTFRQLQLSPAKAFCITVYVSQNSVSSPSHRALHLLLPAPRERERREFWIRRVKVKKSQSLMSYDLKRREYVRSKQATGSDQQP